MTTWERENAANVRADQLLSGHTAPKGVDPLATMTPEMYRKIRAQLQRENLWR